MPYGAVRRARFVRSVHDAGRSIEGANGQGDLQLPALRRALWDHNRQKADFLVGRSRRMRGLRTRDDPLEHAIAPGFPSDRVAQGQGSARPAWARSLNERSPATGERPGLDWSVEAARLEIEQDAREHQVEAAVGPIT